MSLLHNDCINRLSNVKTVVYRAYMQFKDVRNERRHAKRSQERPEIRRYFSRSEIGFCI